jgi:hypothetical protein
MRHAPLRRALALACLLGAGACGPVQYINQVPRKAQAELEAAEAANAAERAPYYYTLAVHYMRRARQEAARADYGAASRFGRKAEEAARQARAIAVAEPETQEPGRPPPPQRGPDGEEIPPGLLRSGSQP